MTSPSPIVLPRPNLGPEPWPDPPLWPWLVAVAVVVPLTLWIVRRLRRRSHGRMAATTVPTLGPKSRPPSRRSSPTASARPWSGRSGRAGGRGRPEEVAASPDLAERFGEEVAGRVVDYLRAGRPVEVLGRPRGPAG